LTRFESLGQYDLKFIQKDNCKDGSDHLFTYIYKFWCEETKLHYIVRAECHKEDVIALKFYCKKDKRSKYKYNKIINRGSFRSVTRILNTCTTLIPIFLEKYPHCSFALCSARSIDFSNPRKLTEYLQNNQRYRIYTQFIQNRIGSKTFTHIEYPSISCYLLINNKSPDVNLKEMNIKEMFARTYHSIPDITV